MPRKPSQTPLTDRSSGYLAYCDTLDTAEQLLRLADGADANHNDSDAHRIGVLPIPQLAFAAPDELEQQLRRLLARPLSQDEARHLQLDGWNLTCGVCRTAGATWIADPHTSGHHYALCRAHEAEYVVLLQRYQQARTDV